MWRNLILKIDLDSLRYLHQWISWRWMPDSFENFKTPFFERYWKFLPQGHPYSSRTSPFFFLFKISLQIKSLKSSKVLAKMGRSWQADWVTVTLLSNFHRQMISKCWKFKTGKWLNICCDQCTPDGQHYLRWTLGVYLLRQIFSHLHITQKRIKISSFFLKFSAFVYHLSVQIWQKNFGCN